MRRDYHGEQLYLHHSPGHRWNYLGGHAPDEMLLLKMFDSDPDVKARSETLQRGRSVYNDHG